MDTYIKEHIGITRVGNNTKIHAVVDELGNPLYVQLSGGQMSGITVTADLFEYIDQVYQSSWQTEPTVRRNFARKLRKPG